MNARILLIEDDRDTREVYATSLRRSGYQVLEACDGAEGVSVARADRPDVILMDLGMPRVDGWEATERLKSSPETANIPVLAITAHAHPFYRGRAQLAGCSGFLEKSGPLAGLLAEVARLLPPATLPADVLDSTLLRAAEAAGELHGALSDALADLRSRAASPAPAAAPGRGTDPRLHDALFQSFPRALVTTDAQGVLQSANALAGTLLGATAGELAGTPFIDLVARKDRDGLAGLLAGAGGGRRPAVAELWITPRGALPLQVEATVALVDGEGPPLYLWVLRDLVSHRTAEAARLSRVELLSAAVRLLPAAVALLDLDGSVLAWNAAAERLLGWREDEVAGSRNPALAPGFEDLLQPPAGTEAATARGRMRHRDGTLMDVQAVRVRVVDAEGQVRGAAAVLSPAAPAESGARPDAAPAPARAWSQRTRRRVLLAAGDGDLAERLADGIAAGRYLGCLAPGDRLPSVRGLAASARTTVRGAWAALRRLAGEGVVEVRPRMPSVVGSFPPGHQPEEPCDAAEWLARAAAGAFGLELKVPQVPELARRWLTAVPLVCACVETCEDDLVALEHDLAGYWGMRPYRVSPADRAALAAELRKADVVLTTPFHEPAVRAAAAAAGKPVVVCLLNTRVADAVASGLAAGPLTVVAADGEFARRLRVLEGSDRLRFVDAADAAAVAALDPDQPVLMTRAAERLCGIQVRRIVPSSLFLLPSHPKALARIVIRHHRDAERTALPPA